MPWPVPSPKQGGLPRPLDYFARDSTTDIANATEYDPRPSRRAVTAQKLRRGLVAEDDLSDTPGTMRSRTYRGVVFLADDDDLQRETLEDLLEDNGYLVLSARSGNEALGRMRGVLLPGVAIVDLVMPGMDGWNLINAMKADVELTRIPIIVLSAHDHVPESVERVFRKPYQLQDLLVAIRELCG